MIRRLVVLSLAAPLLLGAPAHAGRAKPVTLHMPRFDVAPHSDREVCTFVRVPMAHAMDVAGQIIASATRVAAGSTSHHFLLYAYTGTDLDGYAPWEGKVVDSKNCLDMGPSDATSRVMLGGAQTPRSAARLRKGLALRLEPLANTSGTPAVGFILNSHWINGSDKVVRGAASVKLLPARAGTVKKYVKPIFEVVGNAFIDVDPGKTDTAGWSWGPGRPDLAKSLGGSDVPEGPACVVSITGHMHQWGTRFLATYVDDTGARRDVYDNDDYDHPGQTVFEPPLLVQPGERIEYECDFDNGIERPMRYGCEESTGVMPGMSIIEGMQHGLGVGSIAAKSCAAPNDTAPECPTSDPAYPDRTFTGRCVEAKLVFGFTSKDEMCIMPGTYYDADPAAAPGHECDL